MKIAIEEVFNAIKVYESSLIGRIELASHNKCQFCTGWAHNYMIKDKLWLSVHKNKKGRTCFHCLEERLGRPLELDDFTVVPINMEIFLGALMAQRSIVKGVTKEMTDLMDNNPELSS